jgi:hypothetical protein
MELIPANPDSSRAWEEQLYNCNKYVLQYKWTVLVLAE